MITPLQFVRRSIGILVGLGGVSCGLTVLFLGSRAVMNIGGSCGSGGPYVVATPCPDGVAWLIPVSIFGGVVGLGVYAFSALPVGPRLTMLAWPALFLSLGYAFLESAWSTPSVEVAFVVCGVLFVLMGGVPLLFLFNRSALRSVFWGTAPGQAASVSRGRTGPGTVRWTTSVVLPGEEDDRRRGRGRGRERDVRPPVDYPPGDVPRDAPPDRRPARSTRRPADPAPADAASPADPAAADAADAAGSAASADSAVPADAPSPADAGPVDAPRPAGTPWGAGSRFTDFTPQDARAGAAPSDLVGQLERLSALHADGRLDDAEYAAAKARLLNGSH
ncbi:SHOCT domain-containing protein [Sphaerisporangium dianthi]|uniref:SHOCT domain-containing protein n=1 Tax=Sphaerisporangium dianthi TaxID=1436120 RepID=A0ABV9CNK1_9ACTN